MKIKFKPQQYEYLKSQLNNEIPDLFEKLENTRVSADTFNLDEDTIYLLSEWASDKLQRVGYEDDPRTNSRRDLLDEIIDLLYS